MTELDLDISDEDAAEIGFKVAEAAQRVKVWDAAIPGAQAVWHFEMDDVRYQVVVTVAAASEAVEAGAA